MSPYFGEFFGTFLLILMGGGVNANLDLVKTKGAGGGWLMMSWGWGMAVFLGVYTAIELGGSGHLNPAISIGMAAFGKLDSTLLLGYVFAQMAGAFCGAVGTWAAFRMHFEATENADRKLGVFSTSPAIRHASSNFLTELIGTFVLAFGALAASAPTSSLGALDALPVALLVAGIGMGLGGPTGYAINPARDLGPRIAHFVLPISGKRDSDWSYSWIPVLGPIVGALLGVGLYSLL
ncbi:aquaporin family protein [Flavobacteriales bacterium]|nr:aquaporin family protein [Flavobacteriales bacterium]MDB4493850.1 aquaporin family protein [Flavobacteriales bacterium]